MTHYGTQGIYAITALISVFSMSLPEKIDFKLRRYLKILIVVMMLVIEITAKDILVITNVGHGGCTLFNQQFERITQGPAKGEYARVVDAEKYNEIYNWIHTNINQKTRVCYFGRNVLLYMMSPYIDIAVPQLFMDYSSDQVLVDYYKNNPDKVPDLVIEDISSTAKRRISENEMQIVDGYTVVYESQNYIIYER